YLVLSHAHIDHCGLIPRLVREGFRGQIFCTPATLDLTRILLLDSADIQQSDAHFMNKRAKTLGIPLEEPLYGEEDVRRALLQFQTISYGQVCRLEENIELTYTDAGHIIGSAAVHLRIRENDRDFRISFSGDVGRYGDIILNSPGIFSQADYILIESTYGNSLHDESSPSAELLLQYIRETCLERKGRLVIPAFSVGRTQELLFELNQMSLAGRLPDVEVFVDSPLSIEATEVVKSHPECFNRAVRTLLETDSDPFNFPNLSYIRDVKSSIALNDRKEPCVILSASGMADAGRVKHHIAHAISNPANMILITGYCEPHSLGGRLVAGAKEVTIYGRPYRVNAHVGKIRSMSAHGDYKDLLKFLDCQDPEMVRKVFIVHGEYPVQKDFKTKLIQKGFREVMIPDLHEEITLI
ncbi:MAG TPA: MBL fold metallo-hydrolase, partial [Chitinophagaceae bacterium]|nr:MBL fold metallo-hydrolase [Chitinophagaceae bacterium]